LVKNLRFSSFSITPVSFEALARKFLWDIETKLGAN